MLLFILRTRSTSLHELRTLVSNNVLSKITFIIPVSFVNDVLCCFTMGNTLYIPKESDPDEFHVDIKKRKHVESDGSDFAVAISGTCVVSNAETYQFQVSGTMQCKS